MTLQAFGWGLLAASSLVLGAASGCLLRLAPRTVAAIMAFGAGALIGALSIVLMRDAYEAGGFLWTTAGFLGGAVAYTLAAAILRRLSRSPAEGHGFAIAAGSTLDNIPEMLVLGIGFIGGAIDPVILMAIFVSNFPEGLSSAAQLRRGGRSAGFIVGGWTALALLAALATVAGFLAFREAADGLVAIALALAAGAVLAMAADTLIPEANRVAPGRTGLVTAAGFLAAFALETGTGLAASWR